MILILYIIIYTNNLNKKMSSMFSNIFICCQKGEEKNELINNNLNEEKHYKKIKSKTSNSKNSNSNSKKTNMDSNKKYSFIISNSSIMNNQEKNSPIRKNNKSEIDIENHNIIFSNYQNDENYKSNIFSLSENENSSINIFSKENKKQKTIISNIIFDKSFTSENSSSLKNITQILNETKSNKSSKKILRETKPLLFNSSFHKKQKKKNEINLDFDNVILDEEIELAPKLTLTDYKNSNLFNGKIIKIDASGCNEGMRQKRDGMTIFGLKEKEKDEIINDIIVNLDEENNILISKLFVIYYDRKTINYYIQNLNNDIRNNKLMMYIRIYETYINYEQNYNLKYILLGHTIISISFLEDNSLFIKVFDNKKDEYDKKFNEYKFHTSNSPISIGREGCLININKKFISRIHANLIYNSYTNQWKIVDGNGKGKLSSHGTWIILSDNKFELNSNSPNYEVRIGKKVFNIKIENE